MKHTSKEFRKKIEEAKSLGFRIEEKGNTIKLYPPDPTYPFYTAHMGERGIHPIRRYLKKYLASINNNQ
jgi:hypothetical protein